MKNLYTVKTVNKFAAALEEAKQDVTAGRDLRVRVSNKNSKMGPVASVSLLPYITCPARCRGTCAGDCYAARIANQYNESLRAYSVNTALAMLDPEAFWRQVEAAMWAVRFFRLNVAGDIIDADFFRRLVDAARHVAGTEILVFTKRFEIVNDYLAAGGEIPANLHVLFSGWTNLQPVNPYSLPETNVIQKNAEPEDGWKVCGGNCFECACRGVGCWQAKSGDVIAFPIH